MDKDELDLLQDVTPRFVSETRIIDGQKFEVPRMIGECGALFIGPDDGEVQCSVTGTRWLVGQQGKKTA